uniref:HdeD family acid-resistance protein n=1 Tax=Microbacterium lacticum TaxID=33885 RepID=UPI00242FC059
MARTGIWGKLALVRLLERMPAWVRIALSIASIVLGAVIVIRPTTALDVLALLLGGGMVLTGILSATGRVDEGEGRWRGVLSIGWIVLGVFVLAWPGLTVRAVAIITGVLLLVNGAAGVGTALLKDRGWDDRIADAAFGVTGLIFGVLALVWPDITLLVVAVVFGGSLIIRGIVDLWGAWARTRRRRREEKGAPEASLPKRRWGRAA